MSIYHQLQQKFPNFDFKHQYPLATQTYFKIGGPAEVYLELNQKSDVVKVLKFCQQSKIQTTILGGGSNVVVSDEGISGLVLHLKNNNFIDLNQGLDDKNLIKVGAGLKTALLVKQTVDLGYTGLEYFLGVPGTVGGAVFNNAHYLENLIADHIHQVEVLTPQGEIKILKQEECEFGYDSSRFHRSQEVILEVTFALQTGDLEKSQELIKKATQYRAQTQPLGMPSSGCIFKNTPNLTHLQKLFPEFKDRQFLPAGFLIDQAGLKGSKIGDIEVSTKHAAFFVNHGRGTAKDFGKLVQLVKNKVKQKFDIQLEEEIFYLS